MGLLHPGNEILQRRAASTCRGCLLVLVAGAGAGHDGVVPLVVLDPVL